MAIAIGSADLVFSIGEEAIGKISIGESLVYSAGSSVTYHVDTAESYVEEVDSGASCLNPTTFTPTKDGWIFVGWRQDISASGEVLSSLKMGDLPIELYAVFTKTVIVTYYNGSTTASKASGNRYYNNGNTVNPSFTIIQASKSGWSTRGWSTSSKGNAEVEYSVLSGEVISESVTLYGLYYQTITLAYNGNGSTSGSVATQSASRYYNSIGNTVNPSFTISANGFTKTDYMFGGWTLGSATGTAYAVGDEVALSRSSTMYAVWVEAVTNFSYTGGVQTFIVPATGLYKLETWGAQGGSSSSNSGGKGGYAVGYMKLTKGQALYVCVGGTGEAVENSGSQIEGGYNGGGGLSEDADGYYQTTGGGATHIATGNRGILSNYKSNQSEVLLVGPGGGGASHNAPGTAGQDGGAGGGLTGANGGAGVYGNAATGGSQSSGGIGGNNGGLAGSFGQGGGCAYSPYGGAGGGGLYGGGAGQQSGSGAGGSAYIGGVPAITHNSKTYSPSTTAGQNEGNGKAAFTYIAA